MIQFSSLRKHLKPFLFSLLVICSLSCSLFLYSVSSSDTAKAQAEGDTVKQEEVLLPDVFAVKNMIKKILKYLPAS